MEKNPGAATPTRSHAATTLKDLGITKSQSSRWQLTGTVSDENYRSWLDSLKGETFPTSAALRNLAKRQAAKMA